MESGVVIRNETVGALVKKTKRELTLATGGLQLQG